MIYERNFFDHPVENDNIWKITTDQGDSCTTCPFIYYTYYWKIYKLTAINLSKQQALDVGQKTIQQINFTGALERARYIIMASLLKKQEKLLWTFYNEL